MHNGANNAERVPAINKATTTNPALAASNAMRAGERARHRARPSAQS